MPKTEPHPRARRPAPKNIVKAADASSASVPAGPTVPAAAEDDRPQALRRALETALGQIFEAVDQMHAAVAANDEAAANAAGAALLAAATEAKASSTDIDGEIAVMIGDRLRAADAEAARQLEEKRAELVTQLAALPIADTSTTEIPPASADQGGSGNPAAPAASHVRVRVIGPAAGRRRAGHHFTPEATTVDVTPAELASIAADPSLSHQVVTG